MLRDLPPSLGKSSEVMIEDSTSIELSSSATSGFEDPLDDVFGSASPSPQQTSQSSLPDNQNLIQQISGQTEGPSVFASTDPSDVPRLRSRHVTEGYREGIAASKDTHLQEGFDEGFALGAEIGLQTGIILGVFEGIVKASLSGRDRAQVNEMLEKVGMELTKDRLVSSDFFHEDGNWKFDVSGTVNLGLSDEGREVFAFRDVAAAHPVLQVWLGRVRQVLQRYAVGNITH